MIIDTGMPTHYFTDVIASHSDFIDFVKFGWGTSVVAQNIDQKISCLRSENVLFYFGGTLFEKYLLQNRFDEFRRMCHDYGCTHVEVSNGTIDLADDEKAKYVAELSDDFVVISEVGSKNQMKSENMVAEKWIRYIYDDLTAGATLVTLETRESGHGGMCLPSGELRFGLVESILTSGFDPASLLFEAPSMDLQSFFVQRVGPNVNLGNIAASDVVGLETIRLGLRSETLVSFEPVVAPLAAHA